MKFFVDTASLDEIREAHALSKIHESVVVKIPLIEDGIKALKTIANEGIRTNCTLYFSPARTWPRCRSTPC